MWIEVRTFSFTCKYLISTPPGWELMMHIPSFTILHKYYLLFAGDKSITRDTNGTTSVIVMKHLSTPGNRWRLCNIMNWLNLDMCIIVSRPSGIEIKYLQVRLKILISIPVCSVVDVYWWEVPYKEEMTFQFIHISS